VNICRIDSVGGDGCFSLVFKAKDNVSKKQRPVALKFFDPLCSGDSYLTNCFHRESEILKDFQGQRNILPLVQEKTSLNLILEHNGIPFPLPLMFYSSYLADFNLRQYIYGDRADFLTNLLYFREMCKAVQRIHSKKLCHRDLKPGNFLVYKKKYVCLSDFGTSRYFNESSKPLQDHYRFPVGDKRYTAPELLCGLYFSSHHNYCADIYSLGAILFELFTKTVLGPIIFPDTEEIVTDFYQVAEQRRIEVFNGVIESISRSRSLPSIRLYNETVPKSLACEVDRLYQSMACLDYRRRETNFETIFIRLNICIKIIQIQKQYEEWRRKKEQRRKDRLC
jgi:serine/threonine protein kinase